MAVIRELAESPNLHQALSPGRELVYDPRERWAIYLGTGTGLHGSTVQRVRLSSDEVDGAVEEIRSFLRDRGRSGAEWELGESCTPHDLVERLAAHGILPDEDEPVAIGMVLRAGLADSTPPGVTARRVGSVAELIAAHEIQHTAFGADLVAVDEEQARIDFESERVTGSTFIAFVDGEPAAAAYASYTPHGVLLFGGATLPAFRGRGAYRALVSARAAEAAARSTPALVTHAGQMSRPILEQLGFEPLARIDRLLDRF